MPDPVPPKSPRPSFREDDSSAAPASSRLARGEFRPEKVVNPPPRFLPVAYRVPPDPMFDAVLAAFRASGIVVEAMDRAAGLLRGNHPMDGPSGREAVPAMAVVTASIAATDTGGSRLLLSYDRPPGTRMDPFADGKRLEEILAKVDETLAG